MRLAVAYSLLSFNGAAMTDLKYFQIWREWQLWFLLIFNRYLSSYVLSDPIGVVTPL